MATINKTTLKKYISVLKKEKRKVITCEILSEIVGIYPEVIADFFAEFDPLVKMDFEYNLKELLPLLETSLDELEQVKTKVNKVIRVGKKTLDEYESILQFVYVKMTIGGIVDQSIELSDKDLKILKKLIIQEERERRKVKKNK